MTQTRIQQVVERLFLELFDQELRDWIREQRTAGVSWRRIEKELYVKSSGDIDVSHPTLLTWYGDNGNGAAA